MKHESNMSKEEYIARINDIRDEMCRRVIMLTAEYMRQNDFAEIDDDGIRLHYDNDNKWYEMTFRACAYQNFGVTKPIDFNSKSKQ